MVRKSSSEKMMMKEKATMNMERLRMLKRNQCLKKKTMELSTLCGIDAMIICLGNDGEITDTWPEKNPQIESVINRYRNYMISEKERAEKVIKVKKNKKLHSSSRNPSFDESSLEGGGVSEKELREYEMELEKIIQNPSFDDRFEGFSGKELNEFEMELELEKNNNRGECIDSSLVPWVSSFSSSSCPTTELDEDPSMVLNFDTMMSTKFAEKNPSFASCSSEFLVEEEEEEKEGFLWDYQNLDSEFLMGGFNAAVASYCSKEFSVEGDFDDTALPTVEEVLNLCNTATVTDDRSPIHPPSFCD